MPCKTPTQMQGCDTVRASGTVENINDILQRRILCRNTAPSTRRGRGSASGVDQHPGVQRSHCACRHVHT